MTLNITDFTQELVRKDGVWCAKMESGISYPETGNEICYQIEENSFWFKHRNNCIVAAVKKYNRGKLFFDIGGGNGYVAKGLEDSGIDTVLIEPGMQGCLNAKKRRLENIVCATLQDAQFKEDSLPSVGLFDVVEHIEKDEDFLRMIHGYLKRDCRVYITVPAYGFLWSNEDVDAGHYRRYNLAELCGKLKATGFTIEYASYMFSILPVAVFLFRSLPSRLGFNKNSSDVGKQKNEHQTKSGILEAILDRIWRFEVERIEKGKPIAFGGSCFVVARK